eukprot:11658406-Prorocentrum_lima.AAC.1
MAEVAMIVTHRLGFELTDWLGVVIAPLTSFPNFNVLECPYEAWWELAITPVFSCSCPYMAAEMWEERATSAWQQLYEPLFLWRREDACPRYTVHRFGRSSTTTVPPSTPPAVRTMPP